MGCICIFTGARFARYLLVNALSAAAQLLKCRPFLPAPPVPAGPCGVTAGSRWVPKKILTELAEAKCFWGALMRLARHKMIEGRGAQVTTHRRQVEAQLGGLESSESRHGGFARGGRDACGGWPQHIPRSQTR